MTRRETIRRTLLVSGAVLLLVGSPAARAEAEPGETESAREAATARAAEAGRLAPGGVSGFPSEVAQEGADDHPLFAGTDNQAVDTFLIDTITSDAIVAFSGAGVWGSAYDSANERVLFNDGTSLFEWPVGGTTQFLGTVHGAGGDIALVGLAFYDGVLYGTRNTANEGVYTVDLTTFEATLAIDYDDDSYDLGGLSADPVTGVLYATNDDETPFGIGIVRFEANGDITTVGPYPSGQTDVDGLAVGDGKAHLITDDAGDGWGVFNLDSMTYVGTVDSPFSADELFAGGAWISPTELFSDGFESGDTSRWDATVP